MSTTLGNCYALGNPCMDLCACAGFTASCHVQLAPTTPWRWRLMDPCSLGVAASMASWATHPFMLSTSWCLTSLSCSQHPTRLPRWSQATCSHGGASRPLQLVGSLSSNQVIVSILCQHHSRKACWHCVHTRNCLQQADIAVSAWGCRFTPLCRHHSLRRTAHVWSQQAWPGVFLQLELVVC